VKFILYLLDDVVVLIGRITYGSCPSIRPSVCHLWAWTSRHCTNVPQNRNNWGDSFYYVQQQLLL